MLSSLYDSCGGPSWAANTSQGWLVDDPCFSAWAGIGCSASNDQVTSISLRGAGLTGALPASLGELPLALLDLRNNELEYPSTASAVIDFSSATASCRLAGAVCLGVPPNSCTAFGSRYQLSLTDPTQCDYCPADLTGPIVMIVAFALGAALILVAYVVITLLFSAALARWISTLTILVTHAQTLSIISGMGLAWPQSLIVVMSALRFEMLAIPEAACIFASSDGGIAPFWLYAVVVSAVMLLLLTALLALRLLAESCGSAKRADQLEFVLTIVYSAQLVTSWRFACSTLLGLPGAWQQATQADRADGSTLVVPLIGAGLSTVLLIVQAWLCASFVHKLYAFRRGTDGRGWYVRQRCFLWPRQLFRCRACGRERGPERIAPRRLAKQVEYFTARFAPHAPCWQLSIWLKQLALLSVRFVSDLFLYFIPDASEYAPYIVVALAVLVIIAFWRHHRHWQPFPFHFQNLMEECLFGANVVLLVFAAAYAALDQLAPCASTIRTTYELILMAALFGGLSVSAVIVVRDVRAGSQQRLAEVNLADMVMNADRKIDAPLREALWRGDIRLLRCSWLLSSSELNRMSRSQELPDAAFFSPEQAAQLLDRADRSVLALSYRWLTSAHPEPQGTTLEAVRRYLASDAQAAECGLFWDYASLPQRGLDGSDRTDEEAATFKRALSVMGLFYASIRGTAVLQFKDVPPRPSQFDGQIMLFGVSSAASTKEALTSELSCFGAVVELDINPISGQASVRFATHSAAEECIAELTRLGRAVDFVYNATAYDRDCGSVYSGWCTFEQAVAKMVSAHLEAADRQASKAKEPTPTSLPGKATVRAKLIDISDGGVVPVEVSDEPAKLLSSTIGAINGAKFVGKADKAIVQHMLSELEWIMKSAMDQAELARNVNSRSFLPSIAPRDIARSLTRRQQREQDPRNVSEKETPWLLQVV